MSDQVLNSIPTPADMASDSGLIGNRHLLAVQTFDIARLTTHPVPLVPGTFVVVSGQGPKGDSNGSGKTSFLAAVSLLLGEAQWRLEANGSQYAANLLFKPESAGLDPEHRYAQADRGYIVGVFADPAKPAETAMTVWLRIAAGPPYLKARWTHGLHVAAADTDHERDAQADALWEALPRAHELGPRRFAVELYGDAPRCMAYLDTPMRPSAPSLLSQQMTEMSAERIGQALIELTGRQGLLETEEEQRGKLAEQQSRLAEKRSVDERDRIDEQADLDAVHHRDRSRAHLAEGERMWRLHFARGFVEAWARDAQLGEDIEDRGEKVNAATIARDQARAKVDELRERRDLQQQQEQAEQHHHQVTELRDTVFAKHSRIGQQLSNLADRRNEILPMQDAWTGISVSDAGDELDSAQELLNTARVEWTEARRERARAEETLAAARSGTGGPAAEALAALAAAKVPAVSLLDQITLEPAARAVWEPRLWRHRATVVVSRGQEIPAVAALTGVAGAVVAVADGPLNQPPTDLPEGVSAKIPIGRFLRTLAARTEHRAAPDRALDADIGESTIGGFPAEIVGRAARIAAAEIALAKATLLLAQRHQIVQTAELGVEAAKEVLTAAKAVAELAGLTEKQATLQHELEVIDGELATLNSDVAAAIETLLKARMAAETNEQQIEHAMSVLTVRGEAIRTAQADLDTKRVDRENLRLPYWLAGWAGTPAEAQAALDAEPEDIRRLVTRSLRHRAAEKLKDALDSYCGTAESLPPELAEAQRRRQQLADGEPGVAGTDADFTSIARPLRDLLDSRAESDRILRDRILRSQMQRTRELDALQRETDGLALDLHRMQDMISGRIEASLKRIDAELDGLNRARDGFGAQLRISETRPPTATSPWKWEVTPRWRRSPTGGMVSYREVANGAQVKVFAIQLVLAALLAADGAQGRVLVLDELGNSLGDVNRRDVLRDLNEVAAQQQITVLGTCQDSVIGDAAGVCGEILWFCHNTHADAYNQPTRVWGYDDNGNRVNLIHGWLTSGRNPI